MSSVVMALDSGTTSIRAILFDHAGEVVAAASQEFPQIYPQPGWVEHNPLDIWNTQITVAKQALAEAGLTRPGRGRDRGHQPARDHRALGPGHRPAGDERHRLAGPAHRGALRRAQGRGPDRARAEHHRLWSIDAYFSGTKLAWMLDNVPGARERAERGELAFGTVDSWLIWNLTGGAVHVTDYTNASRTMLFDIHRLAWDEQLLKRLNIPAAMLPEVRPEQRDLRAHPTRPASAPRSRSPPRPATSTPPCSARPASSRACVKTTYGTGASLVMNTGDTPVRSDNGPAHHPGLGYRREGRSTRWRA